MENYIPFLWIENDRDEELSTLPEIICKGQVDMENGSVKYTLYKEDGDLYLAGCSNSLNGYNGIMRITEDQLGELYNNPLKLLRQIHNQNLQQQTKIQENDIQQEQIDVKNTMNYRTFKEKGKHFLEITCLTIEYQRQFELTKEEVEEFNKDPGELVQKIISKE